jgi:hypothetical protein
MGKGWLEFVSENNSKNLGWGARVVLYLCQTREQIQKKVQPNFQDRGKGWTNIWTNKIFGCPVVADFDFFRVHVPGRILMAPYCLMLRRYDWLLCTRCANTCAPYCTSNACLLAWLRGTRGTRKEGSESKSFSADEDGGHGRPADDADSVT